MASERPKRNVSSRFRRDDGSATPDEIENGRNKRPRTSRAGAAATDMDMDIDGDNDNADGAALSDDSFDSGSEKDMDETEDFVVAGKKKKKASKTAKAKAASGGATSTRKNKSAAAGKSTNGSTAASSKKRKATAAAPSAPARRTARSAVSKDQLKINDDVPLFQAVKNPETALQTTAEDWVVAYQSDPGPALTELINFIIRCCASNSTVDETLVRDVDNVVDSAQEILDEFKTTVMPSYPIVSGSDEYKKFKKSLSEFFSRLFTTASESELLLTAPVTEESSHDVVDHALIDVLKEWLSTFSSSTFRSFRHTATFIVLNIVESLASLLLEKRKSLETTKKQRDGEKKKTKPDKNRVKQLEDRWQADKTEERALSEAMRDLIDSVFEHRFRDADPSIRTDCTTELGRWVKTHPDIFLRNEYIRYLGISLTDPVPQARIAAIKALLPLYARSAFPEPLRHFTELHKDQLVQIVAWDSEVNMRVHTIETLIHIDRRGLLENSHRSTVGVHIFDSESRIRREVAFFLRSLIEDEVAEVADDAVGSEPVSQEEAERDASAREKRNRWETEVEKLRLKLLAKKLVQYNELLDGGGQGGGEGEGESSNATAAMLSEGGQRVGPAVKALWDFDDLDQPLSGWSELVELLLYDHSGQVSSSSSNGKRKNNAAAAAAAAAAANHPPNTAYTLAPAEETVLLEALVAVVEQIGHRAENAKPPTTTTSNDEEDPLKTMRDSVTRFLVPKLPRLFAKYRTETRRVAEVLALLPLVDLRSYASASTGQASVFANLWDEVGAQFTRHSESAILSRGAEAVQTLCASTHGHPSLADVTAEKVQALQESLVSALRGPLKGQEAATSALDADTVFALEVNTARLLSLARLLDCSEIIEDSEGGAVSSGWEILRELAQRGKLGYAGEDAMVSGALTVLSVHLIWRLRGLATLGSDVDEDERKLRSDELKVKRNEAIDLMEALLSASSASSVVRDEVRAVAASRLLQVYLVFHSREQQQQAARAASDDAGGDGYGDATTQLRMADAVQQACVDVMVAEIERFVAGAEDEGAGGGGNEGEGEEEEEEEEGDGGDDVGAARTKQSTTVAPASASPRQPPLERLKQEQQVFDRVRALVSAMRLGLVDLKLSAPIIAKYRRAGPLMDALIKSLFEDLREVALMGGDRSLVVDVILSSLKESFERFLSEGTAMAMDQFVALSRSLSTVLVLRGPQLTILRSIDSSALLDLHRRGSEYVAKKWKAAERASAKSIKARAPVFWKGLVNLLVSATPRDAFKIKAALDTALANEQIEVPAAAKAWDPHRAYERKMVSVIARAGAATRGAAAAAAKPAGPTPRKAAATTAATAEGTATANQQQQREEEGVASPAASASATAASPPPSAAKRPRARPVAGADGDADADADGAESDLSDAE